MKKIIILFVFIFCLFVSFRTLIYADQLLDNQLMAAAAEGDVTQVKKYITQGANINQYTGDGYPLFMVVFCKGVENGDINEKSNYYQILKILSAKKANFNAPVILESGQKFPPFFILYLISSDLAIRYLNFPNINVNQSESKSGETMLMLACGAEGKLDLHVIKLLLKKGAKVNTKMRKNGATALMYCVKKRNGAEAIKLLVSKGADVNILDDEGKTVLYYAEYYNDTDAFEFLSNKCKSGNCKKR